MTDRGPPAEILTNNDTIFHSKLFKELLEECGGEVSTSTFVMHMSTFDTEYLNNVIAASNKLLHGNNA